jgi:hypothetical protein
VLGDAQGLSANSTVPGDPASSHTRTPRLFQPTVDDITALLEYLEM